MYTYLESIKTVFGNTILFSTIPIIWWILFYRKKESFLSYIGIVKPKLSISIYKAIVFFIVYILFWSFGGDFIFKFIGTDSFKIINENTEIVSNNLE